MDANHNKFQIFVLLFYLTIINGCCHLVYSFDGSGRLKKDTAVNINTARVSYSSSLTAFHMQSFDNIPPHTSWIMSSDGETVGVSLSGEYIIMDGGLTHEYRATQFQFHWGTNSRHGARHSVNNQFAPAELNIIHYNTKYRSLTEASGKTDGLAVLTFLYQPGNLDNPAYNHLINHLQNLTQPDETVHVRPIPLLSLLPSNLNNYYRYHCDDDISWTVFKDTISISKRQLRKARTALISITPPAERKTSGSSHSKHEGSHGEKSKSFYVVNDRTILSSNPEDSTIFTSPLSSPIGVTIAAFIGVVGVLIIFRR